MKDEEKRVGQESGCAKRKATDAQERPPPVKLHQLQNERHGIAGAKTKDRDPRERHDSTFNARPCWVLSRRAD